MQLRDNEHKHEKFTFRNHRMASMYETMEREIKGHLQFLSKSLNNFTYMQLRKFNEVYRAQSEVKMQKTYEHLMERNLVIFVALPKEGSSN